MKLLCNVIRGTNIESRHEVYAVAIDEDGKIIFSAGNPDYITCIRSSLKPFQASTVILSGATESLGFNKEEIALMCASHNGEEIHVKTAMNMAKKLKLTSSDYECGNHAPYDAEARQTHRADRTDTLPQQLFRKTLRNASPGKTIRRRD